MHSRERLLMMLLFDISDVMSLAAFISNALLLSNSINKIGLR
jgi:hypothetical protein